MNLRKVYKSKKIYLLISSAITFLVIMLIKFSGIFNSTELTFLDLRNNLSAKMIKPDTNIVMVTIDDNSLKFFENNAVSWPFPREFYGEVNNFLTYSGAKAIIYDIHFSSKEIERLDVDPEQSELKFAESIKENGNVYLVLGVTDNLTSDINGNEILPKFFIDGKTKLKLKKYTETEAPLTTFQEGSAGLGVVTLFTDPDNIIRRIPLMFNYNNKLLSQISFLVYSKFVDKEIPTIINASKLPIDEAGNLMIRWYGGGGITGNVFKYYPISKLIISGYRISSGEDPVISPSLFKNKIVIVGGTAHGLGDFKPVAINSKEPFPGMEIHATVLSNLINKHFIVPAPNYINLLIILFLVIVVPSILIFLKKVYYSLPIFIVFMGIITYLNIFIYGRFGYYLDFIHAELTMLFGFLITAMVLYIIEGKQKNEIRKTFNRYMSPQVIDEILKNPDSIELGGREVFATVFFSDIKEFTNISERYSPAELVQHLNEYFSNASSIILEHKAMLDKYIGDAIMAVFGAPIYQETHAIAGCRAALKIQRQLDMLYKNVSEDKPVFITRMGLNSGKMIVGNIGTTSRLDYTAIGDAVNTASRMEGLNKIYGTRIIISESTFDLVKNEFEARELDLIAVKGKNITIRIYELLGEKGEVESSILQFKNYFENGLKKYQEKKWNEALVIFKNLNENEKDLSVELYIERCQEFILNPPDINWNGVFYAKIK